MKRMPKDDLPKPTKNQLAWQDMEMGMFIHFGLNTFNDREWGDGTDSPSTFNPTELDARQWIRIAKQAGFKYVVLTAKHHDGFCLWPTETTDYSVKSSPWKNGKGDVVGECAQACREEGIGFGVYLSPWDRHEPTYNNKELYDDFYCRQLTELLTWYGPLVEIWFDGAGSEGREYDWERIMALVDKYQPDAMVFNMGRPTIRWVGNEDGVAPYPCWNTARSAKYSMFTNSSVKWLPGTPEWLPAECDVPIRKGQWFWHPNSEHNLCSLDELMDIYYRSVGHGATLLLNVAPDNRGLIPEADAKRVLEFGNEIRRRFQNPIAKTAGEGYEIYLNIGHPTCINHAIIMEDIAHGERVLKYKLEAKQGNGWVTIAEGSAIGHKKIDRFADVCTDYVKLTVLEAAAHPIIREFSIYCVK